MPEMTLREAINQTLREALLADERVFLLGEDIGVMGGVCRVTQGLWEEFGPDRVMDTPLAETGIMGLGMGAALVGMRPIVEIQTMDFTMVCADQIINQVAKARYISAGLLKVPLVIRTHQRVLMGTGPHHSGKYEGLFAAVPGLTVMYPSTPYDARGLLKSAIRGDNPVLFIEERILYEARGPVPEGEYSVPIGEADIKRRGTDVTVVSYGRCLVESLKVATKLAAEGVEAEVVDLRTLRPLDTETVINSVKKTGRLVIVHDATKTLGPGAEIAAAVAEAAPEYLEAPVRRVAALETVIPHCPSLERAIFPDEGKIARGIMEVVQWAG